MSRPAINLPELPRGVNSATEPANLVSSVLVPRWIIYFQAALLGIVATTFFVFGIMVGHLTSGQGQTASERFDSSISGLVQFSSDNNILPDAGAVVFLLPKERRPEKRGAGSLVSPDSFEPLNNPSIDLVHQLGGAIVRTDSQGKFNLTVDGSGDGISYFVFIVSKNVKRAPTVALTKPQTAAIGTFFMPVDRVVEEQAYHWSSLTVREREVALPPIRY